MIFSVMGISQWLLNAFGGQNQTVSYPIAFTNTVYSIILENINPYLGNSNGWYDTDIASYTLNNAYIHYADARGFLLAVGY